MINFIKSSIGRKFLMAISAIFLIIFLTQHFIINLFSVFSPNLFNKISYFMGTNLIVQFILQPILIIGIFFHFIMGFILEIKNKKARGKIGYSITSYETTTWMSKNMLFSGLVILSFLIIHFIDFWINEINIKYIQQIIRENDKFYIELVEKFHNIYRVVVYIFAFIFLGLHLAHGFQSAFQSIGLNTYKYKSFLQKISICYAILIPAGFSFIALYHYFNK